MNNSATTGSASMTTTNNPIFNNSSFSIDDSVSVGSSGGSISSDANVLAVQMQLFMWTAAVIWLICAFALYNQQIKWKKRRRSGDDFHQLRSTANDREARYLVSFFTGRGYRHAPSGNVRLHLIGSVYPGKFHTLRLPEPEPTQAGQEHTNEEDTESESETGEDEDDDVKSAAGESGGALNRSKSRRTIKSDLPQQTKHTPKAKANLAKSEHKRRRSSTRSHHHKHLFPPNSHEKFLITEDVLLGRIRMVVLQTEVDGKHPYWDCETVIVRSLVTNEAWYFKAHARIGFPPVILDPATVEELTAFSLSWYRRVRREVRHGQYVYFGFFFRPNVSVYTLTQRVIVAIVCYLILFFNTILLLGLAFPPESDPGGTRHYHSHFVRSRNLRYWISHVAATGALAALCTTIAGYLFVRLFSDKYTIGVHEMDYVIGTALQEYNEMKSAMMELSVMTGKVKAGKGKIKQPVAQDQDVDVERQSLEKQKEKEGTSAGTEASKLQFTLVNEAEVAGSRSENGRQGKKPDAETPSNNSSASTLEQLASPLRRGSLFLHGMQTAAAATAPPPGGIVTTKSKETAAQSMQSKIEDIARKMWLPLPKPSKSNPPTPKQSPVSTLESELSPQDKREMMRSLFEQENESENEPMTVIEITGAEQATANPQPPPHTPKAFRTPASASSHRLFGLFPHPHLAYLLLAVLFLIPLVTFLVWLTPIAVNLTSIGLAHTLQMILSTYAAAVLIEVLGMELIKMGLLGAYYAYTDKRLYKKIVKTLRKRVPSGRDFDNE